MKSATQILTWVHLIVECNPKCEDSENSVPEHFAALQKQDRNGNNAKLPTANVQIRDEMEENCFLRLLTEDFQAVFEQFTV